MIDEYLNQVAQSGILGVLLVIALFTIFYQYKEAKAEREAFKLERAERVNDLKSFLNEDRKLVQETKNMLGEILNSIKGAKWYSIFLVENIKKKMRR